MVGNLLETHLGGEEGVFDGADEETVDDFLGRLVGLFLADFIEAVTQSLLV